MSQKNTYKAIDKFAILEELKSGRAGRAGVASKYKISVNTLVKWRRRYELYGMEGLEIRSCNKSYTAELKLQAVQDYLSGHYSQYEIIDKYKISSRTQLKSWVDKYNGHSSLKSYGGGTQAMTKGRTTTWQERIDIVLYCLAHNQEYQKTADHYKVSYQQAYQWVKKYEDGGEDALQDGRGRNKAPEELNEADRQKIAMKKLAYENERLRAENALLKKLQELERRRR
ncbi:helix-turn-helix domain-containing protein [Paenibacillus sp. FSL H7-0331]|uniref:helix-turn-helix domain-containing protein n=1 Tax=Paenibacillus sp. FSL H7-0331 TaxID=1920421 RepID=UPI00096E5B5F|nr:helix-turn-helix domain-containing protein [Paenibacillus sp. FSL H7-0331]OMF16093.1 transposase [Paenibacillus sp. FSL H7-0331]